MVQSCFDTFNCCACVILELRYVDMLFSMGQLVLCKDCVAAYATMASNGGNVVAPPAPPVKRTNVLPPPPPPKKSRMLLLAAKKMPKPVISHVTASDDTWAGKECFEDADLYETDIDLFDTLTQLLLHLAGAADFFRTRHATDHSSCTTCHYWL